MYSCLRSNMLNSRQTHKSVENLGSKESQPWNGCSDTAFFLSCGLHSTYIHTVQATGSSPGGQPQGLKIRRYNFLRHRLIKIRNQ